MTTSSTPLSLNQVRKDLERIFKLQKDNQQKIADSAAGDRRQKLDRLHKAVLKYRTEIREAY